VLQDLSPLLSNLVDECLNHLEDDILEITEDCLWQECPFPIREFILEKGLLRNFSRETSDSLRKGFLWGLILRNRSSRNIPALSKLLGMYMTFGRSQTEKNEVLSKLRVIPSRTYNDNQTPRLVAAATSPPPLNPFLVASFDNQQQ